MTDSFNNFPRDQQIVQLKKQISLFKALQFIMPALMIFMALAVTYRMPAIASDTKRTVVAVLSLFAVADFALLRFMIIPIAQKRLADVENS